MLQIPCPWCGVRDEDEYRYGGSASVVRPADDAPDAEWGAYLYVRDNPRGAHRERWCHVFGCGRWLVVVRDTLTHDILESAPLGEPAAQPPVPSAQ